jgi:hypothetical protein
MHPRLAFASPLQPPGKPFAMGRISSDVRVCGIIGRIDMPRLAADPVNGDITAMDVHRHALWAETTSQSPYRPL